MSVRETARAFRTRLKEELSRALTGVLYERTVEQGEMADAIGTSATIVQRQCDRRRAQTTALVDVVMLHRRAPEAAEDLLRWAANHCDLVVARRGSATSPASSAVLVARDLVGSSGALTTSILDALADGQLDELERARLRKLLADVEQAVLRAQLLLAEGAKAGGAGA